MRALLLLLVLPVALAGCGVPEESVETCGPRTFVTVHYDDRLNLTELERAFVARSYEWNEQPDGTVEFVPPAQTNVRGVVSNPSAAAVNTVLTFEERDDVPGGGDGARAAASDAAAIVNETFEPRPTVQRWIVSEHDSHC